MSEPWPEDRRQELQLLIYTLTNARDINNANNCLVTIPRVIDGAERLLRNDLVTPRPGLLAWLVQQSHGSSDGRP